MALLEPEMAAPMLSVPALTVVPPPYELATLRLRVLAPDLTTEPLAPEIPVLPTVIVPPAALKVSALLPSEIPPVAAVLPIVKVPLLL
jgi:hypothetical protein